jgi:hypothetical protein
VTVALDRNLDIPADFRLRFDCRVHTYIIGQGAENPIGNPEKS